MRSVKLWQSEAFLVIGLIALLTVGFCQNLQNKMISDLAK